MTLKGLSIHLIEAILMSVIMFVVKKLHKPLMILPKASLSVVQLLRIKLSFLSPLKRMIRQLQLTMGQVARALPYRKSSAQQTLLRLEQTQFQLMALIRLDTPLLIPQHKKICLLDSMLIYLISIDCS